ncbi:MAG: SPFH domain-containing protein [Massiliimalia sp.]|jgi:regulator of protease activity HflC (stomatin/prohibitin superfamily)
MPIPFLITAAVILIILIFLVTRIKIVPQAQVYVIERLGTYYDTWNTGVHLLIPFLDRIAKKVSLKEFVVDFKPQPVITKDNVTMQIDTVVFYQVTDAKLFTYGVERPMSAIENLTATTLRNIIGDLELDHTLTSRDFINSKITSILDQSTDRWGIKVNRVELKNIIPPAEIQDAMEKQMKAERERRETMLRAEGEKKSSILVAEGQKQARILEAEAQKESQILRAEAEKQATILHAEAVKEQKIREAQGEAEAIEMVQKALADSIVMLNSANPNDKVLALKSLEAFQKAADGKATKLIIPSQIQSFAGLAASAKEIFNIDDVAKK